MDKTKLCIFDLDGTLLDTIDDIAGSMNRILAANGCPARDAGWYKERVGNGARNLLLNSLPPGHGFGDERTNAILKSYKEDYRLNSTVLTKPYDGIPELLSFLAESSIQIAVVTNKPQESADAVLKKYFGHVNFVAVCGEKPGRPLKPDPATVTEALLSAGASPKQAVFIGDSETDMILAKRASIFSVGVLWGFRNREVLEAHGADAIVERPGQITGLLNLG